MSSFVRGVGKFVSYTFNSIDVNSAANDVIAVRHKNGRVKCTPFAVRFGRAKVLRPADKVVTIEVNGEPTEACMKIAPDGAAFWLEPTTDVNVPPEQLVSPLGSPCQSPMEPPESPPSPLSSPQVLASSPEPLEHREVVQESGGSFVQVISNYDEEVPPDKQRLYNELLTSINMEQKPEEATSQENPQLLRLSHLASKDDIHRQLDPEYDAPLEDPSCSKAQSDSTFSDDFTSDGGEGPEDGSGTIHFKRSFTPMAADIEKLKLKLGANTIVYKTRSAFGNASVAGKIFLWDSDTKIVVTDIDGTVTRSDVLGHLLPRIGKDWTHNGICRLFSKIEQNGYQLLYVSARALTQIESTKSFIFSVEQYKEKLPNGPMMLAPDRFYDAFRHETSGRSYEFKIACLKSVLGAFPSGSTPLVAGFGNRFGDAIAYTACGIPLARVFIIDANSVIHVCRVKSSYKDLSHLVDAVFPDVSLLCVGRGMTEGAHFEQEFNSFNYWRVLPADIIRREAKREDEECKTPPIQATSAANPQPSPARDQATNEAAVPGGSRWLGWFRRK